MGALAGRVVPAQRRRLVAEAWRHVGAGLALTRASAATSPDAAADTPLTTLLADAVATLERQARRHPRRADTHHHLAVCLAARGEAQAAQVANRRSLQLNPRYAAAAQLAARLAAA